MSDQKCPNIEGCPMFPYFRHEGTLAVWKINYCESSDHTRCERYRLFLEGKRPEDGMLPNGSFLPESMMKKD
jgi:hypothetical protein